MHLQLDKGLTKLPPQYQTATYSNFSNLYKSEAARKDLIHYHAKLCEYISSNLYFPPISSLQGDHQAKWIRKGIPEDKLPLHHDQLNKKIFSCYQGNNVH